ncbi:dehydratase family domain-containing protein [Ditylenchus destructor]|uniref:Dehydratase family domain-containing protein n=1 Tax=Ditylenchus destructor TaxID=166010 RepID=A0AAD4MGU6_9BILA|nr:dehydratase family domain-containing protein [Ditylenchus destructor]
MSAQRIVNHGGHTARPRRFGSRACLKLLERDDRRAKLRPRRLVRQSRQYRHDPRSIWNAILNFGLSLKELRSGRPIIGIAQTGSDLSPCNRHHLVLAERVREGIRDAGGIAIEFPVHPIQETGKRPTPGLDRNLAYLGLVEALYGYPLDGVVLTIGLRQDDTRLPDGSGDGEHSRHSALGRTNAQRLAQGRTHRLGHDRVESAPDAGGGRDRRRRVHPPRRVLRPLTGYCNTMERRRR